MEYLIEAKNMGIEIALPHINLSATDFAIEGDRIRFGLNSIKYISDTVAGNIMKHRPYESYKDFSMAANKKYSGINSRAIASLNSIGAAAFEDNPKTGKERDSLYDTLGLPEFAEGIPDWVMAKFDLVEDFDPKGNFVFFGLVKAIKRGKGWSRVEIVDKSGSVGVFDVENTLIEPGQVYVIGVASNSVVTYCKPIDIIEKRGPLAKYLMSTKALCATNERYVIGVRERVTKTGTTMATVLMSDDLTDLDSAVVFSFTYDAVKHRLKAGTKIKPVFSKTRDGGLTIKEIR
jgi:DNA polymerase-3 subunit alpha